MNIKIILITITALLLMSCEHMSHHYGNKADQPITLNLDNSLDITLNNGVIQVLNERGEVISEPVDLPDVIFPEGSPRSQLVSVREISVITIRGSCVVYVKSGSEYVKVTLPPNHPLCN